MRFLSGRAFGPQKWKPLLLNTLQGAQSEELLAMAQTSRPLSPHLSIYRFEITMAMSILHRITGFGLYAGTLVVIWWLGAVAAGGGALDVFNAIAGSLIGQLVLFCFTWALFHHLLGGLRHFVWDMGAGFSHRARFGFAWATLIGGFALAVLVWLFLVWL